MKQNVHTRFLTETDYGILRYVYDTGRTTPCTIDIHAGCTVSHGTTDQVNYRRCMYHTWHRFGFPFGIFLCPAYTVLLLAARLSSACVSFQFFFCGEGTHNIPVPNRQSSIQRLTSHMMLHCRCCVAVVPAYDTQPETDSRLWCGRTPPHCTTTEHTHCYLYDPRLTEKDTLTKPERSTAPQEQPSASPRFYLLRDQQTTGLNTPHVPTMSITRAAAATLRVPQALSALLSLACFTTSSTTGFLLAPRTATTTSTTASTYRRTPQSAAYLRTATRQPQRYDYNPPSTRSTTTTTTTTTAATPSWTLRGRSRAPPRGLNGGVASLKSVAAPAGLEKMSGLGEVLYPRNGVSERFVFFGGKGGVGKTSTAAAVAIQCADAGLR